MSRVARASRLPCSASRGTLPMSLCVATSNDVRRVLRETRSTAGGTPALPDSRRSVLQCVGSYVRTPRDHFWLNASTSWISRRFDGLLSVVGGLRFFDASSEYVTHR